VYYVSQKTDGYPKIFLCVSTLGVLYFIVSLYFIVLYQLTIAFYLLTLEFESY